MVGAVTVERPYFYCTPCRHGFYPLDEALGLSDHVKQMDIQEAGCELALDMPYEQATQYLDKWTDASISDCVLHDLIGEIGQDVTVLDVCPTREEIQQRIAQVGAGHKWKPILVLGIDGAAVPTRPDTARHGQRDASGSQEGAGAKRKLERGISRSQRRSFLSGR